MGEWNYIIILPVSGALFAIGGTGFKWVRRFILPVFLGGMALLNGVILWKCALMTGLLMGAFCLPYGEKIPMMGKAMVGCCYSLATIVVGYTAWQIMFPFIFTSLFILSGMFNKTFTWKICEFIIGSCVGIMVAQGIL